jgi:isopentenyl diphosphate isomerase/L-lactate dehydrogenase-like FMN-dependent dehydrogenase
MAPVGVNSLFHEDKEIGVAQACAALHVPFTLSTVSESTFEEVAAAVPESPRWFQLYWPNDDEITASLLKRAKDNGFTALVVTLDTWTLAWRPHDLDTANVPFLLGQGDANGFSDPVFRRKFAEMSDGGTPEDSMVQAAMYWIGETFPGVSRSWEDLKILKKHWDGPIILKGILSVEDAVLAAEHGMDGIIVSNHGGRQIDGAIATLDVLPEIVDAVGSKLTVMMDSGIRTGADIIKALALGAKAVLVGRPVIYGLGINGKEGAEAVLAGILADLDLTMGFAGVQNIAGLKRAMLRKIQHSGDIKSSL